MKLFQLIFLITGTLSCSKGADYYTLSVTVNGEPAKLYNGGMNIGLSQDSSVNLESIDTGDRNLKVSLMSHPQNEDATKYVVGRRSSPLEVDFAIDSETNKFKVTVTNDKKPPPYTTDIYMSDVAVSGNEFSLDGRKMQWICTQEREGVDRNDPNKSMADRTGKCNSAELNQVAHFALFLILAVFFM